MSVLRPIGGRGKKQPYETKIMRIPSPLVPLVDWLCDRFYESHRDKEWSVNPSPKEICNRLAVLNLVKEDVIKSANVVLAGKRSAKLSLGKLLQVLFDDDSINL